MTCFATNRALFRRSAHGDFIGGLVFCRFGFSGGLDSGILDAWARGLVMTRFPANRTLGGGRHFLRDREIELER